MENELNILNEDIPIGVYLPLWEADSAYPAVCRTVPQESRILKSRERVPFLISMEVIEQEDPVSSTNIHSIARKSLNDILDQCDHPTLVDPEQYLYPDEIYRGMNAFRTIRTDY